jgi:hypothetical protein
LDVPAPRRTQWKNKTFKLPRRLAEALEATAHRQKRSANALVVELLARGVGEENGSVVEAALGLAERARERRGGRRAAPERPFFERDELYER